MACCRPRNGGRHHANPPDFGSFPVLSVTSCLNLFYRSKRRKPRCTQKAFFKFRRQFLLRRLRQQIGHRAKRRRIQVMPLLQKFGAVVAEPDLAVRRFPDQRLER